MTASTLTHLPLMAGSALLGTVGRAGLWTISRYMRAPLASTGLLAMVTMTALAGSNALFFQTAQHPSPFFAPSRHVVAPLPTPIVERPVAPQASSVEPAPLLPELPQASPETTGSVAAPVQRIVPDAPVGNAQMFAVQKKLLELQLFTGEVDGYYGPKTAEAIRAFEQRNGMTPTGANDPVVIEAILDADSTGRVSAPVATQPQALSAPAPVAAQPVPVQQVAVVSAPASTAAPVVQKDQDRVVARLQTLSPAEQVFDEVAQSAASTIDSIIAAVDGSRGGAGTAGNPPIPSASLPSLRPDAQPVQPVAAVQTPQPAAPQGQAIQLASAAPAAAPAAIPPATDVSLVTQIQTGLASLGFFRGPIDGKPGPETARAIREFENFHRYRMTGQVQPDLVELLLKAGATI
ncbi:peptidoglycan hydrolase-like protein with peptidoglycan-binding domain [Devosia subaequoris]|uniref:Peptidoglycan hydrolase-like protein with peptidoglycan-binding domain n=1 Tax=Devosia subaequoris TaxID=395930 RepID=A0A7W6IK21_9HYPH|nr:peptidoglycan-binding domain-containing protein [Devosia subaequoris]MBB4051076.1 peptidoglycan hydrolase-like protein with peptidoglycan-binding domain [Devosia subaequoris]MCP1208258.1 peptidoglycan-binding protein [Devosia subaequoris]